MRILALHRKIGILYDVKDKMEVLEIEGQIMIKKMQGLERRRDKIKQRRDRE